MAGIKLTKSLRSAKNSTPKIGDSIRFYRKIKGIKTIELAGKLEISESLLRSIENDNRKVKDELLQKIAKELDTTVDNLTQFKKIDGLEDDPEKMKRLAKFTEEELQKAFLMFLSKTMN